jgi:RNA polymerase sigma-70 factor, ECF subfamily
VTDAGGASAPLGPTPEPHIDGLDADAEILRAVADGDRRKAISLCARQHGASIGRLCMAMLGSQMDADDMTQETLLTAHQCLADFRGDGSVRGWLLGIARNKCLQHLEKSRRRGARLRLVTNVNTEAPPAPDEMESVQKRAEQARQLLTQVRPSDRDALLLRYSAELSFKEVALACGIDEAAARKRVSRALLRLRDVVGKEDSDD